LFLYRTPYNVKWKQPTWSLKIKQRSYPRWIILNECFAFINLEQLLQESTIPRLTVIKNEDFYMLQLAALPLHETFLSLLPLADISLSAPSERAIISSPLCLSVSYTGWSFSRSTDTFLFSLICSLIFSTSAEIEGGCLRRSTMRFRLSRVGSILSWNCEGGKGQKEVAEKLEKSQWKMASETLSEKRTLKLAYFNISTQHIYVQLAIPSSWFFLSFNIYITKMTLQNGISSQSSEFYYQVWVQSWDTPSEDTVHVVVSTSI